MKGPKEIARAVLRRVRRVMVPDSGLPDLIHAIKNDIVGEIGGVKQQNHAAEFAVDSLQQQQAMTGTRVENVLNQMLATRDEVTFARNDILAMLERVAPAVRLQVLHEARLTDIDEPTAAFLNYARSHRGPLSDVGLWLNDPLVVEWTKAGARIGAVNERIVEQPFVLAALADLAEGSSIVDVGGGESTLGLSLASLGHQVTVIEPAGYPLRHPNLTVVEQTLEDFAPDTPPDAVILLSAIEHFGIGAYANNGVLDEDADLAAMALVRSLLAPGGTVVLTTPFGPAAVDELERTYDLDRLTRLFEGYEVDRVAVGDRVDHVTWTVTSTGTDLVDLTTPDAPGHVVMVRATTPTTT